MERPLHPIRTAGRSGLELVISRAATDADFRSKLLASPHTAIREAFGVDLPLTLRLRFLEKDRDVDLIVVLPDLIDHRAPLEARDLDGVSGGMAWLILQA